MDMKPAILIGGRDFAVCMPRGIEQMTTVRDVEVPTDRLSDFERTRT